MHGFPGVFGKQREVKPYSNTTATATTINPNATVGVWTTTPVQLVASTAFDVSLIRITAIAATANSNARGDLALEVMTGSAGNEVSLIGPLLFGGLGAYSSYTLPMFSIYTATTITAQNYRSQFAIASTTDAATMVTNATGVFDGPTLTGNTSEALGQWYTATFPTRLGLEDIIYAQRPDGAALSARSMASGTADTNAVSAAILAAVM